jgi:hypothetical protein
VHENYGHDSDYGHDDDRDEEEDKEGPQSTVQSKITADDMRDMME